MAASKTFCRTESIRAGDPLAGTATHHERNLLVSWPRSHWMRNLRHANNMEPELIAKLDALAASGRRVNLIYRRGEPERVHRAFLFPEGLAFDIPAADLLAFVDDVQAGRDLSIWAGCRPGLPVMMCCTHGKKDKCCAKFGYSTYRQLSAAIEKYGHPVDLWESSHLGGCRLAASIVSFPSRRKYGRVGDGHIVALLEHESRDQPYLPCYRGNGGLTPAQQCAEAAALQWLEEGGGLETGWFQVETEQRMGQGETPVQVRVQWQRGDSQGTLIVRCEQRDILRVDTCADLDAGPTPSSCWQVNSIEPEHYGC